MKKSTVEKMKMLMEGGEINNNKINLLSLIIDDDSCPITLETDIGNVMSEAESFIFESTDKKVKIVREVIPIYGDLKYKTQITQLGNFIETKHIPYAIISSNSLILYIEEYKETYNNQVISKEIISKKLLIFTDCHTYNLKMISPIECYIIA